MNRLNQLWFWAFAGVAWPSWQTTLVWERNETPAM